MVRVLMGGNLRVQYCTARVTGLDPVSPLTQPGMIIENRPAPPPV